MTLLPPLVAKSENILWQTLLLCDVALYHFYLWIKQEVLKQLQGTIEEESGEASGSQLELIERLKGEQNKDTHTHTHMHIHTHTIVLFTQKWHNSVTTNFTVFDFTLNRMTSAFCCLGFRLLLVSIMEGCGSSEASNLTYSCWAHFQYHKDSVTITYCLCFMVADLIF